MNVSVLVPWAPGCPHREAAWSHIRATYASEFPTWEIITGDGATPDGFSRTRAILDAYDRSTGDALVVADADCWVHPGLAVLAAVENGWAVPHTLIHRLSADSTAQVLAGASWRGLPLSTDNQQDQRPYKGNETGTCVVLRRDVFVQVPPDPRFVGWGQEDQAWGLALRCLIGPPWRGTDDLVHLWHPPQPRQNRRVGSPEGMGLLRRYQSARRNPGRMRQLIEEAACSRSK